ncbi:hypothetical protein LTS08_007375 [Lithohypha guttulata]|nr:hypothetical protein LTS08_007375 [Lithohypha guttulata]
MGTRHLILVWYKGKWAIAQYGQYDGYPTCQGRDIIDFITNNDFGPRRGDPNSDQAEVTKASASETPPKDNIAALKLALDNNMVKCPDDEQLDAAEPSFSRTISAGVLSSIAYAKNQVSIVREVEFVTDYLFCEWAYVIDLDKNVFEIYSDKESKDEKPGRFDDLKDVKSTPYRPAMLASRTFEQLARMKADRKDKLFCSKIEAMRCGDEEEVEVEEEEGVANNGSID